MVIKARDRCIRGFNRLVAAIRHERQQCLGEPRQIPFDDGGLIGERIAPELVDRAEHLVRMVGVHESAWAVVDRLARDRGVVGVQNTMNESNEHPACGQPGQRCDHRVIESPIWIFGLARFRVVPRDRVVGENTKVFDVAPRSKILKRADAQMARCNAGQDAARQRAFAHDVFAGQHRGERARRRNAKRGHGLADNVFADDRAERGAAIAAP